MTTYHRSTGDATDALRTHVEGLLQRYDPFAVLAALREVTTEVYEEHRSPVQAIVDAVAEAHNMPVRAMLAKGRTALLSQARHHAAWEIRRRRPDVPLVKIAAWLNRTDHTTIIHSLGAFQRAVNAGRYEAERAHVERALA